MGTSYAYTTTSPSLSSIDIVVPLETNDLSPTRDRDYPSLEHLVTKLPTFEILTPKPLTLEPLTPKPFATDHGLE